MTKVYNFSILNVVYARGYNLLSRLQLSGSDETVSVVQQTQYGYFLSVYGIAGWMKDEHIRFAFFLQDGAGRDRKSILLLCTARMVTMVFMPGEGIARVPGTTCRRMVYSWLRWLSG